MKNKEFDKLISDLKKLVSKFEITTDFLHPSYKFEQNPCYDNKILNPLIAHFGYSSLQTYLDIMGVVLGKKPSAWVTIFNDRNIDFSEYFLEFVESKNIHFLKTKTWNSKYQNLIVTKCDKNARYYQRVINSYCSRGTNFVNINMFHMKMGLILGFPKENIIKFCSF